MSKKFSLIIFTDLDGSLLHRDTFKFDKIKDYIKSLINEGIIIIPNTSKTEKEIEEFIKADWLIYQDLEDLISAAQVGNEEIRHFECSIFNGKYVTDDIDDKYLKNLEDNRNDKSKASRQVN